MKVETDSVRQAQAGLEAVEVLKEAGFIIGGFRTETEPESVNFRLSIDVSVPKEARPLQHVE